MCIKKGHVTLLREKTEHISFSSPPSAPSHHRYRAPTELLILDRSTKHVNHTSRHKTPYHHRTPRRPPFRARCWCPREHEDAILVTTDNTTIHNNLGHRHLHSLAIHAYHPNMRGMRCDTPSRHCPSSANGLAQYLLQPPPPSRFPAPRCRSPPRSLPGTAREAPRPATTRRRSPPHRGPLSERLP
jgi:hypothetical protein